MPAAVLDKEIVLHFGKPYIKMLSHFLVLDE